METTQISLDGEFFHSDAQDLKESLTEALSEGPVTVDVSDLEKIELGPLQVLISAALTARASGTEFAVTPCDPDGVIGEALARHALPLSLLAA